MVDSKPRSFEYFAKTELARVVRFVLQALKEQKRVLVASALETAGSVLQFPTVLACAVLIVGHEIHYEEAIQILQRGCYFYSTDKALVKKLFVQQVDCRRSAITEDGLLEMKVCHDVETEPAKRRASIPDPSWLAGVEALDDRVHQRALNRTRKKQTNFSKTFIM